MSYKPQAGLYQITAKIIFCLSLSVIFSSVAMAERDLPESLPTKSSVGYEFEEDAALAALLIAANFSKRIEYGGCIYHFKGVYHFTEPVTNGRRDRVKFACKLSKGSRATAIFHTHPKGSLEGFSKEDVDMAKRSSYTSYIGCMQSGDFRQFVYGRDRVRRTDHSRMSHGVLLGRPFRR